MVGRPLRWAVIGAGGMGRWHVKTLLERNDVSLVAACDVVLGALEGLPAQVNRFADWRDLLENAELDAASVILPHGLYPEVVGACLEQGIHVFKEKPFARNLADALAMSRAARASGRQLIVAGQHKFTPCFEAARAHLPELGEVFLTRANILYRIDSIMLQGKWSWRGTRSVSGGVALLDSGWHILELVTLLRGLPSKVTASTGQMRVSAGEYDVDEQAALILEYPDGGIAVVLASFVTSPGEIRLVLYGKRASMDVDVQHGKLTYYDGGVEGGGEGKDLPLPADPGVKDSFSRMYDHVLGSIETGMRCPGSWEEAVYVQRIVEAGYLSVAEGGRPVGLEEVPANV